PVTDYNSTLLQWVRNRRPGYAGRVPLEAERPSPSYIVDLLPPIARDGNAVDSIPARFLHSSLNKIKHPVNVVVWTPEGRRLLTASSSGEFTLWNGMGFNFETIMQAHENAIRAAVYSHSNDWLLSADQDGVLKYWQPNFNNVKAIQAHNDAIRGIAFAPTDSKFVTAADDSTLKIFDFAGGAEELTLTGHQWELRSVDWHPTKGLIASASKDHLVKLWDPRNGRCLTTLSGHKNHVLKAIFEPTQGQLLASGGKDHIIRVFDLRMMRDVFLLRGHEKDVNTLAWHPVHRNLLSSGGADGSINHYLLDEQNAPAGSSITISPYDSPDPQNAPAQTLYPAHTIPFAHDFAIWSLNWHPLGHIFVSGSNDRVTRFWTRPRPGDTHCFNDRYHIGQAAAEAQGTYDRRDMRRQQREEEEMEAEDEAEGLVDQKMPAKQPGLPGLPGISLPSDGTGAAQLPGIGQVPFPPPAGVSGHFPPPPIPGAPGLVGAPPPPPPNPTVLPPGFQFPQGFPMPLPTTNIALPEANGDANANVRRRIPLPSQQDSLKEEMRQGRYKRPRG
ncbi:WD40 repeat-like protein, partial [Rhizodiscina lignyota]